MVPAPPIVNLACDVGNGAGRIGDQAAVAACFLGAVQGLVGALERQRRIVIVAQVRQWRNGSTSPIPAKKLVGSLSWTI